MPAENQPILLINPWIYDFAAYDLWSKPLGLLYIAAKLRHCGFSVELLDCMDIHNKNMGLEKGSRSPVRRHYGTGKFWRERITPPDALKDIKRAYSRYGLSLPAFRRELEAVRPSAILVTSLMTYWYPGVQKAIEIARSIHPDVPLVLGGIYASLCADHAREFMGADYVVEGKGLEELFRILSSEGIQPDREPSYESFSPYPAFDLIKKPHYACILTSRGCPFRCAYCAGPFLEPEFEHRDPYHVLDELLYWKKSLGVQDFAFYDDALLIDSERYLKVLLREIAEQNGGMRFHTPNAIHAREVDYELALLMKKSGFETIRIGLETSDFLFRRDLDCKISEGEFERAVRYLLEAGFRNEQIGAYILMGLPEQSVDSVFCTIEAVERAGAFPYLAEYSPLPHTRLWDKALLASRYDIASEPLFQNSSLIPCWDEERRKEIKSLKEAVLRARNRYRS